MSRMLTNVAAFHTLYLSSEKSPPSNSSLVPPLRKRLNFDSLVKAFWKDLEFIKMYVTFFECSHDIFVENTFLNHHVRHKKNRIC